MRTIFSVFFSAFDEFLRIDYALFIFYKGFFYWWIVGDDGIGLMAFGDTLSLK